ncbi:SH3 domain-containing protein [Longimicrobium sp.]|uniref:SH3 domain-containing protein n=1 Tax=Longimicrobium sp. TaxID=2029185 RepID=UPI002E328968|nr:SH3 domain-containing protein [Longimicrobium sp.]HEX6036578.1 SH3 domain-containing protein [Longimicrobium sp.]
MKRQVLSVMAVGVFAVLALGSGDGDSSSADAPAARLADSAAAAPKQPNSHFAYGTLNVRSGPGERYRVVRQLKRGDTLSLAEPDARGWARIVGADSGYVFTRLNLVRTERPAVVPSYSGECADAMREVHLQMNRAPDTVKEFSEKGLLEVTWWYRENANATYPKYQFSFRTGPYEEGCGTSRIEN